jgi:branched-chain amino acid transport system permease protein
MRYNFDVWVAGAVVCSLIVVPLLAPTEFVLSTLTLILILSVFAAGFDLMFGSLGMVSFGHSAFLGVGGYALAIAMQAFGWPFSMSLGIAVAIGAATAWLVSYFALRVSGIFFALVTLALSQLLFILADSKLRSITGGADGLPGVQPPSLGNIDFYDPLVFYIFVALIYVGVMALIACLRTSPLGQLIQALRQNEIRCEHLGANPHGIRQVVFILSGALSGLAGGLLASFTMYVNSQMLHWTTSGDVIIMTLLGGSGTLFGPLAGVLLFEVLKEVLSRHTEYWHGLLGLVFILATIWLPRGVMGTIQEQLEGLRERKVVARQTHHEVAKGEVRR